MRVAEVLQESYLPDYSIALMSTAPHKSCISLAKNINQSHDKLYTSFKDPVTNMASLHQLLIQLARNELYNKPTCLIFDDSQISKPHAKDIEGLDIGFDGSSGRPELGLQFVSALLNDGDIKIPIELAPYISKQMAGSHFVAKSNIAAQLYHDLIKLFNIEWVIADAHYATKTFLPLLLNDKQKFLMKFPCNRVVKIGKSKGQLKQIFRLRRNEHSRIIKGIYDGNYYYFYVVKVKPGTIVYFICSDSIDIKELSRLYKIRWSIELYHRVAKQYLGWCDCQMRSIERQELHSFYVMYAYAIAEIVRIKLKLDNTENAIRFIWALNFTHESCLSYATGENLC